MEPTAHDSMADPMTDPTTADLLQHVQFVRNLARRLVRDEDEVDDVVQQSFLRAVQSPPRHGGNLRAWFAVVVRNVVYRQARGRKAMGDAHWRAAEETDHAESADRTAERADFQLAISEAVHRLPEPFRTVIVMRFFDELSIDEAAEALGVPRETVRSRQRRGLARLREHMAEIDERKGTDWRAVAIAWLGEEPLSGEAVVGTSGALLTAGAVLLPLALLAGAWWWLAGEDGPASPPALSPEVAVLQDDAAPTRDDAAPPGERTAVDAPAAAPTMSVAGRAVALTNDAPVAGARLSVTARAEGAWVRGVFHADAAGGWSGALREEARLPREDDPAIGGRARAFAVVRAEGYAPVFLADLPPPRDGLLDLGEVRLVRGVPVRGRVVTDGVAVPGAELWLSDDAGEGASLSRAWPVGRADDDGRFELAGGLAPNAAPPFTWTLFAASEGRLGSRALPVDPAAGALEVELTLGPFAALSVRVEDRAGAPLVGVTVRLRPAHQPYGAPDQDGPRLDELAAELRAGFATRTGADGVARFEHLPARPPNLPGLRPPGGGGPYFAGPYDVLIEDADGVAHAFPPLALQPGERLERRFRLGDPGEPIAGVVVAAETGAPLDDAWTVASDGRRMPVEADGRFRRAPGTRGVLRVDAPGRIGRTVEWKGETAASSDPPRIELERAESVTGVVCDEAGVPLAGVPLALEGGRRVTGFGLQPLPRRLAARTDADGRFAFDELQPGDWRLSVVPEPGRRWIVPEPRAVAAGERDIEWTLRAAPLGGRDVRVTVYDRETGDALRPLAARPARYDGDAAAVPRVRCGIDAVELTGVAPGRWRLWVRVSARGARLVDFDVGPGTDVLELSLACGARSRVEGRVQLPGDAPLPNDWIVATVFEGPGPPADWPSLRREYGGRAMRAWVQDDGRFAMEDVVAGPYRLELLADGWSASARVDVPAGETVTRDLSARRAGAILLRGDWPPPAGLSLLVDAGPRGGGWHWVEPTQVGAAWEARVTVPAGERSWALGVRGPVDSPRALPPAREAARGAARVEPGGTTVVEVELEAGAPR